MWSRYFPTQSLSKFKLDLDQRWQLSAIIISIRMESYVGMG